LPEGILVVPHQLFSLPCIELTEYRRFKTLRRRQTTVFHNYRSTAGQVATFFSENNLVLLSALRRRQFAKGWISDIPIDSIRRGAGRCLV